MLPTTIVTNLKEQTYETQQTSPKTRQDTQKYTKSKGEKQRDLRKQLHSDQEQQKKGRIKKMRYNVQAQ